MRNAALVCCLILIPCSLRAQDKKTDWKALYGLRSGEKIELTCSKRAIGSATLRSSESSARAQARESAQQHRDVPIRMVRSTYVV